MQAVTSPAALRAGETYRSVDLAGSDVDELPPGLTVRYALILRDCVRLERLPEGLRAGSIDLSGCTSLERLPEGLSASFLDLTGCGQLEEWPQAGEVSVGRLRMRDCLGFRSVPPWLGTVAQLDLAGCVGIRGLPEGLQVTSWIDVGGTNLTGLPASLASVGLRWRGVTVDERIAFRPDEITAAEALAEPNAELRRVKMERIGFDRFVAEADPKVLDTDSDPGGERRLLRVDLADDEPLVVVAVRCPSTGGQYVLRVPPDTKTCRQAIAWTAGFDDPSQYAPLVET
ncbi:DUF6745 domain-containing protein [Alienimonas californiensis]|uniref:Leucine Rich Repeat protein n=1 Tax=Alienimonas californiensis TaxID=2527989 RepID=A0A517P4F6_9PLAN|nr:hypothetical protein [Alienimonas californiensis]QDT14235.1 Leucine Rich Repeat protein [Alienimonas californiensis]